MPSEAVTPYTFAVPAEDLDVPLHIEAIRMRDVLNRGELWYRRPRVHQLWQLESGRKKIFAVFPAGFSGASQSC
jgi:hypothetical protein